jgi:hypothetical protein
MHSSTIFASALAFAASATAQVEGFAVMTAPAQGEVVPAGETYNVVWAAGAYTGPVSVAILAGATPETLQLGAPIATGVEVSSGGYAWQVDCSLGDAATYGLRVTSEGDESLFQYSFPFQIDNSACGDDATTTSYPASSYPASSYVASSAPASFSSYPTSYYSASSYSTVATLTTSAYNTTIPTPPTTAPTYATTGFTNGTATAAPTGPGATGAPSAVPTAAAGKNAAGSLALVGGIAALVFAL